MVNRTSPVGIYLYVEYNYTCVATSKYGTDVRKYSIVFVECGSVVNNILRSPGYPHNYAANMDCNYTVPIPQGMAMGINFQDFDLQDSSSCSYDYLTIINENSEPFGMYCGRKTGESVIVTGKYAVFTFHSNNVVQRRGFLLLLNLFKPTAPKIELPESVVRVLPGYRLSCPVTGTPPIHTALIRNSTVLANTTGVIEAIIQGGNYTCQATNEYGVDVKDFSVIFVDCGRHCFSTYRKYAENGNTLKCSNAVSITDTISCVPAITTSL